MTSVTVSLHTEKCCRLVSTDTACARRMCSSVRQFLIYSTFVVLTYLMLSFFAWSCYISSTVLTRL